MAEHDQRQVTQAGDGGGGQLGVDGLDGLLLGQQGLNVLGARRH
jgi:hypothetical protein